MSAYYRTIGIICQAKQNQTHNSSAGLDRSPIDISLHHSFSNGCAFYHIQRVSPPARRASNSRARSRSLSGNAGSLACCSTTSAAADVRNAAYYPITRRQKQAESFQGNLYVPCRLRVRLGGRGAAGKTRKEREGYGR